MMIAAMCPGIAAAIPEFRTSDIRTPEAERSFALIEETGAAVSTIVTLLHGKELLHQNRKSNAHFQIYQDRISNGGKQISGPLLVIHGTDDGSLHISVATNAIKRTAELYPSSQLEFVRMEHLTHDSVLPASQRLWMDWIADRFAGRQVERGFKYEELTPARPEGSYLREQNWYSEAKS